MSGASPSIIASGKRLLGREREHEALDRLLDGARAGQGGVLVVHGEAGIGKTALLEYAVEAAPGFRIVRTSGVEAEMELPFAALQLLCSSFFALRQRLPRPQRDALDVAFGLRTGTAPDQFLIVLAVLGLLAEAAEEQPLACVIDDAQWLDSASARTLAFVARRLVAEKIALVFATRDLGETLSGLPDLHIAPLERRDARALLESVLPTRLDERVVERIVAETRGNPLALLELPRGLSPTQLAGGFGLPTTAPLSAGIEDRFMRRLANLPPDARRFLLVAAADPVGDPALVWQAGGRLGIPESAASTVESEQWLALSPRVVFRHPLVRSAVYRAAEPNERREVHRALADATDAEIDPDRRAWHRAQATAVPDEEVAAELERSAARAQARGGFAAAAAFLERAVALSPEPARRAQRALAAAQAKFQAGALDDALDLLEMTEAAMAVDDPTRGHVQVLRAQIAFTSRRGSDATAQLLAAARELEALDPPLARATYLEAISAGRFAGRLAHGVSLADVSEAALAGPSPPQPSRPPDLLLEGLAIRFTRGYAEAAPILKSALSGFSRAKVLPPQEGRWLLLACRVASDLWDDETLTLLSARELQRCRDAGALSAIPLALDARSWTHAVSGELAAAAALLDEARTVGQATRVATVPYAPLWLAALRGNESELVGLAESTVKEAMSRGEGFALAITELTSAVLYNGVGRYDAALAACRGADKSSAGLNSPRGPESELIEAAVRCGERHVAERALERLTETTRASGTHWALGVEAQSRALLGDAGAAEGFYREAIARLARTRVRVQLARARLLYGEWLRRQRRRLEAREQLRTAHEFFRDAGMEGFAERARLELEATGERARKRTVDTLDELTPQETQVARLAAQGETNREIAARLFISASTVEYHLRKAFRKLDIKSRRQLKDRLAQPSG